MQYIKLNVCFKGLEGEVYPYFLGSFIRGNFGMYLKKVVCPFRMRKSCNECLIHKKCFYAEIFETEREVANMGRNIPPPFVIELEEMEAGANVKKNEIEFSMLLYGPVVENFEFFILVFAEMGKNGIGKQRIKSKEVIIEDHEGGLIYSSGQERILRAPRPMGFEFKGGGVVPWVGVRYKSPVRLKREGKVVREPDFETLIRAALRRLMMLESFYGEAPGMATGEIVEAGKGVKTVKSEVRWVDRYRYSNRSEKRMNLGGILGRQEFEGEILGEHMDLLRYVSVFHMGKSSTFGNGKIEVESREERRDKTG